MDIRRIPLWESRNATYMSNDLLRCVIEDQGEVTLELSALNVQGGRVNSLCIPYFRGTGSGVGSDVNQDWWKGKQSVYQAGGIYLTFPSGNEDIINTRNTYWMVRRYGSESEYGGVWRLSEMKSRAEDNRYKIQKIDLLLPGHPVLYTLNKIENTGYIELEHNISIHSMLAPPFLESGCLLNASYCDYVAFPPSLREVAFNRLRSGSHFFDLKHAPALKNNSVDLTYVPPATGSYDYIMGSIANQDQLLWTSVINPRQQLLYLSFYPSINTALGEDVYGFENIDIAMNWAGRMDTPWALFDGGTPELYSITTGAGKMDHHGAFSSLQMNRLKPGEVKFVLSGQAFTSYDNPRLNGGFYTVEKTEHGLVCKRTKSYAYIQADYDFSIIRQLASKLLKEDQPL